MSCRGDAGCSRRRQHHQGPLAHYGMRHRQTSVIPANWFYKGLDIWYHTLGYATRIPPQNGWYVAFTPARDLPTLFGVI